MKGKAVSVIMPSLLLIGMLTMAFNLKIAQASPETIIYVDPQSIIDTSKVPGTTFSVDIRITDVAKLRAFQFRLNWTGPLLNVTDVVEGPFLKTGGPTFFIRKIWNTPDPVGVSDYIYVVNTHFGDKMLEGVSGSGLLATVTFLVEATGASTLHLYDTMVVNRYLEHIPHTLEDGYFNNAPSPRTMDELKKKIEEFTSEGEIDNQGIVKSLIAKLNAAQKLVEKGRVKEAKMIIECFIIQVQKLSGIHITVEATDILIQSAEYIVSHL